MKTVKIKMLESVAGDRISLTKGAVVAVSEELAKDLIKAKYAEQVGKPAAKPKPAAEGK